MVSPSMSRRISLAHEAFDGLIAAVEPALGHQILPNPGGIATLAQTQFDRLTKRFAQTGGRNGLGRFMPSVAQLHAKPGGHRILFGRFCRRSPSPGTWRAHSDPGRFQVGAGGLPTHPGLLLDAPQGPSESAQGYDLLFFRFAQDVAYTDEGYCLASESTSPSFIFVGRF